MHVGPVALHHWTNRRWHGLPQPPQPLIFGTRLERLRLDFIGFLDLASIMKRHKFRQFLRDALRSEGNTPDKHPAGEIGSVPSPSEATPTPPENPPRCGLRSTRL